MAAPDAMDGVVCVDRVPPGIEPAGLPPAALDHTGIVSTGVVSDLATAELGEFAGLLRPAASAAKR
jgi:hypothetical protein